MKTVNFKEEQLTIVKIWCSVKNRVPYYIISQFFKFTGTFVSDDLIETETSSIRNSDNVPTFYISNDIPISRDSKICYIDTSVEPWNNLTLENCSMKTLGGKTKEGNSIAFLPIIEYMKQVTEEFPEEIYSKLWNIFIENNLVKALMNFHFFGVFSLQTEPINANSEEIMIKAIDLMDSINDIYLKDSFQYKYAELYLKAYIFKVSCLKFRNDYTREWFRKSSYKVSDRYAAIGKYNAFDLVQIYKKLCNEYVNINIVNLGIIVVWNAVDGFSIAEECFEILIKKLENYKQESKCFDKILADVYRKRANFYVLHKYIKGEKAQQRQKYLIESIKCNLNYRIAIEFGKDYLLHKEEPGQEQRCLEMAIKSFMLAKEQILPYLEGDVNIVEMRMYLYIHRMLCNLLLKYTDYKNIIEDGLDVYHFFNDVIKNEETYKKLYGNNVGFYWKACTEYSMKDVYEDLAIAYKEEEDKEKSEFFRRLIFSS